jgi:hypothetical protein
MFARFECPLLAAFRQQQEAVEIAEPVMEQPDHSARELQAMIMIVVARLWMRLMRMRYVAGGRRENCARVAAEAVHTAGDQFDVPQGHRIPRSCEAESVESIVAAAGGKRHLREMGGAAEQWSARVSFRQRKAMSPHETRQVRVPVEEQ